jgi:hypothetical protein
VRNFLDDRSSSPAQVGELDQSVPARAWALHRNDPVLRYGQSGDSMAPFHRMLDEGSDTELFRSLEDLTRTPVRSTDHH